MRKKKISVLTIIFLVLLLANLGCSRKSDYEVYKGAVNRTGDVARGKSETNIIMELKFNKDGLPGDIYDGLRLFEGITLRLGNEYDREREESLKKIFVRTRDIGLDGKIYTKGKDVYIVIPLIPKILIIKEDYRPVPGDFEPDFGSGAGIPALSKESLRAIEKIWGALYNDGNVCALKKIVLSTPEGDVKAMKYEIKLTDEQLKPALKKTIEVLLEDETFLGAMEEMMQSATGESIEGYSDGTDHDDKKTGTYVKGFTGDLSFEGIMRANMDAIDNSTVKTFNQVAFIDRDNYIIEERLDMEILYHFAGEGMPRSYRMEMGTENWDLNRKQDIYFPEITYDNSITLEQLKDGYGSGLNMFEREIKNDN